VPAGDRHLPAGRSLTRRERDIITLFQQAGMTEDRVAEALEIEVQTVKNALQSVYKKLGVRSRAAALEVLAEA
jgi:DNA-binding NarL/FixJ family response regulator